MPVRRRLVIAASSPVLILLCLGLTLGGAATAFGAVVYADAAGELVFTHRFDNVSVVNEVSWRYFRSIPELQFGTPRTIWSGAGAPGGFAGSDGLFFTPASELVVANWEASPPSMWKFNPRGTDLVLGGPVGASFAFHLLLHPNRADAIATDFTGLIPCNGGALGCFGVFDHTPLSTQLICAAPLESVSSAVRQPVTFSADGNDNLFTVFSDGRAQCSGCPAGTGIEFGGGGFASFNLSTTSSASCSGSMAMKQLIPQEISAAHSMAFDPFLSDTNDGSDPHSDFIVFANSRLSHIRVDDPGAVGATASVVSTVNMATEASCASLLPAATHEFDQGTVTGDGIAMVGDEANGYVALIDYRSNANGTILDAPNMVCLTEFLADEIDDLAPLARLGG